MSSCRQARRGRRLRVPEVAVALPMDEQRILDEMERGLAAEDPKLAARLAAFGRPGIGAFRSPRARAMLSLASLTLAAACRLLPVRISRIPRRYRRHLDSSS